MILPGCRSKGSQRFEVHFVMLGWIPGWSISPIRLPRLGILNADRTLSVSVERFTGFSMTFCLR